MHSASWDDPDIAGGLPALSVQQPWAHLIVSGQKDIVNRTWSTRHRGPVLIHAGKKPDPFFDAGEVPACSLPREMVEQLGGVVGVAEIVDCVQSHTSPWFFGWYGFVLRNARTLPFRACRGQLGFFRPAFASQ